MAETAIRLVPSAAPEPRARVDPHRPPEALTDVELLATFLDPAQGTETLARAQRLLHTHGGLRAVLAACCDTPCPERSETRARHRRLGLALELGRRYIGARIERGQALTTPDLVKDAFSARLRHRQREVFACLFLSSGFHVIAYEELFRGTVDASAVHPRVVAQRALQHNAKALVFAHNHPGGSPHPSAPDRTLTERLRSALALFEIEVKDHIVIGANACTSFAEVGLL